IPRQPSEGRARETAGDSPPGEEVEVEVTLENLLRELPAELRRQEKQRLSGLVLNPIWPPIFCKALRVLVTHPFFDRCPGLLVIAVQYAVKLRTNDRCKWPLESPIESRFLDDLAAAFARPHPIRPARVIHKMVNQARDGKYTPLMSVVLQEIEKATDTPNVAFQGSTDPFDPYSVITVDLRNVATALNNVRSCGVAIYLDS
ncbi:hypothetical protein F5144DRAFT_459732, partial [Chaetomium tenue]